MSLRRLPLTPLDLSMLLFALSAILGVWPAYDPDLSIATLIAILSSVTLYFSIARFARSWVVLRTIGILTLLVSSLFGLYVITQYSYLGYQKGGVIAQFGQLTTLLPNLHGFTPQPNAAAAFLEAAVPLGIGLTLSSRKTAAKTALAMGTLIVTYAIFLTASRGSWLGLGVTTGIAVALVALARLQRRTAILVVGAGILAIGIGLIAIIALGPDRLPFLASTFSRASDRGRLFQNSLYLASDYGLTGIGLGDAFAMVYSRYSLLIQVPFLSYAHNLPLSIWLNQGLAGLIALAGIVVTFYQLVHRVRRFARPPHLFAGAWLGVTATLLHGLTDAPQYAAGSHWVMPMLFVAIGLAAGSGRLAIVESRPDGTSKAWSVPRPIAIGAAIAVIALLIIFSRPALALLDTNLGALEESRAELAPGLTVEQRREGFASAGTWYQRALAVDSTQPSANRRAGNLAVELERFEEAVPLLETAFDREPFNPAAIKGLGLAYTWVGRAQEAARMFHRLDDPHGMETELYTWAGYRRQRNQPLLFAYALEAAQAMYPNSTDLNVWLSIADAYRAVRREDAARVWYNRVLAVEPGNPSALSALAEIGQ